MAASCESIFAFSVLFILIDTIKLEEEAEESGKKGYVDFKRVVWHDSFKELLASIHAVSKTGTHIKCADGIIRHLYPVILILSADYEEQYGLLFIVLFILCADVLF